ncbi:MAG TPA: hypothetical protein VHQ86_02085 [Candidatus Saccharimonadia bacterium]|jgi:hypothetical protein|nr:hypothetical protein [Candidatus Saccharimonadia bacterium]
MTSPEGPSPESEFSVTRFSGRPDWLTSRGEFEFEHGLALGIEADELRAWQQTGAPVLEVGPGMGASFKQLLDLGVNAYTLEPGLNYDRAPNQEAMRAPEFEGRVQAATAADAPLVFPDQRFTAAIAMGVNFQNYSQNEYALVNQIAGVMEVLEPADSSYFSFEVGDDGVVTYDFMNNVGREVNCFDLPAFLQAHHIRYEYRNFESPKPPKHRRAIRIFRQSEDGADAAAIFARAASSGDLSRYTTAF